jgi:hypothetical protein
MAEEVRKARPRSFLYLRSGGRSRQDTQQGSGQRIEIDEMIPPLLKRALDIRDETCRFPGCCESHYVDFHHIEHWVRRYEKRVPAASCNFEVEAWMPTVHTTGKWVACRD